jgi:hypothetical protein
MAIRFDHLVVAARALDEGVAWIESRLGVPMGAGGRHDAMGTHNRLLSLGPGRFLEVIAIDRSAPPPGRARWFELDTPGMAARLEAGPALVTWVVRADDIEAAIAAAAAARPEILDLARGDFRWRIGVPASGSLSQGGVSPTVIQWKTRHPSDVLADVACRLEKLVLRHRQAAATLACLREAGLPDEDPIEAHDGVPGLVAHIRTPKGMVVI